MNLHFKPVALLFSCTLFAWMAAGCSDRLKSADTEDCFLSLSVKNVGAAPDAASKTYASITQTDGSFRGIEQVHIVPFHTSSEVVQPADERLGSQNVQLSHAEVGSSGLVRNNNSHFFNKAALPTGMNRVLVYGKAMDNGSLGTKQGRHLNGILNPEGLTDPARARDITFHLEPILDQDTDEQTEITGKIDLILEQLNNLVYLIQDTGNEGIADIFRIIKHDKMILSCCYQVFNQMRQDILTGLNRLPFDNATMELRRSIVDAVNIFSDVLADAGGADFPSAYGIPDGTYGFWWNGQSFVRLINGVNISLVDPAAYCYPPSLWYYANSSIRTSSEKSLRYLYSQEQADWNAILAQYTDGSSVSLSTGSVAIEDPLQYGVGLLELNLDTASEASVSAGGCKLTGIIIGDQKDLDYRFLPAEPLAANPGRYIFDNILGELKLGTAGEPVQMLVLPTPEHEPVLFALEFQNQGSTLFCQQGEILPWCKFYLAGKLNWEDANQPNGGEILKSVFSRDHKTSVEVSVKSLLNAYNTVPDLHDPQLEIGLVAEMKWMQLTPEALSLKL